MDRRRRVIGNAACGLSLGFSGGWVLTADSLWGFFSGLLAFGLVVWLSWRWLQRVQQEGGL